MRPMPAMTSTWRVLALVCIFAGSAEATEWFVAPLGGGRGTIAAPFTRIQEALDAARPGDVITVQAGTYRESLRTARDGSRDYPIVLRSAAERGSAIIAFVGRVLTVRHAYFTVEGLVLDGEYGNDDTVRIETTGNSVTIRNTEVRRSTRDLIDIGGPSGVIVEGCLLHHALNAAGGRTDAHGIVAGPVRQLTVRQTEIHTFSGDGIQLDPGRSSPGWNDVTLEDLRIWLEPLATDENGFKAGTVPGENAVDTKANARYPRARLTMRNIAASGFRNGLINNMAAFNLKEQVDATVDGVTVSDSEIGFRLRGAVNDTGAWVTILNAVIYDVTTAYRYEDDIQRLRIWNNTVGRDVTRVFQPAAAGRADLDVRNLLVLGPRPREAVHPSNLSVDDDCFVDVARDDYHLASGAPAIDAGVAIPAALRDRDGQPRPSGNALDVGAYEWPRR
jgi:hypothetical protein